MRSTLALPLLLLALPATAAAPTERSVITGYVRLASASYASASREAIVFQKKVSSFLAAPGVATLRAARNQWVRMRKAYSLTEVYRFYGGPIDGDEGPEGLLNAWPLDEAYIDYVEGMPVAGIINDRERYPELTRELLESLNEHEGEKNISVGYHAIEFLLWGQDFSSTGPGDRPYTDYVEGVGRNADRRRLYLRLATDHLVEKLSWLASQWNLAEATSYGAGFQSVEPREALRRILTGAYRLAAEELSQERMFVAYDSRAQEDEHSCFSDTTHLDIRHNLEGIRRVFSGRGSPGVIALLAAKDAALASRLERQLTETERLMAATPVPFDNAIASEEGRAAILAAVSALEDLATLVQEAGKALGLELR